MSKEKLDMALDAAKQQGTSVVHLKVQPFTKRIDRQTKWGNPIVLSDPKDPLKRLHCLLDYVKGLNLENMDDIGRLRGEKLGCWCAPRLCHGDVLATLAAVDSMEDRKELLVLWKDYLIERIEEYK